MMKGIVIAAWVAALAGVCAYGAVNIPFEVAKPAFEALTAADGSPVKMYKQALATAPYLVTDIAGPDDEDEPVTPFWSNTVSRRHQGEYTFQGLAPVVAKKGDWLNIRHTLSIGLSADTYSVWVKGLPASAPEPLTPQNTAEQADILLIADGAYAGYGLYGEYNAEESTENIYIGRLVDGVLVCPYVAQDISPVTEAAQVDQANGFFLFSEAVTTGGEMNLKNLTHDEITAILSVAEPLKAGDPMVVAKISGYSAAGFRY